MPTILVVDDEPIIRMALAEVLGEAGYTVRQAVDGTMLWAALDEPPDLIVLDVNLPEMDGVMIAQRLRQDERTRAIPIIALSGVSDLAARAQAMGAAGMLAKPFDLDAVVAYVRRFVAP